MREQKYNSFSDNVVPAAEIKACLSHILSDQTPMPQHPLGYLTSENRDTWASLREQLLQNGNRDALK